MAIAFDATSKTSTGVTQVSSETFSHTCTGTDRILFVALTTQGTGTVSGITYNGVSMTAAIQYTNTSSSTVKYHVFYLVNPDTGTNNVVITNSTAMFTSGASLSYTGVDQTTPINATGSQTKGTSTSITHSVTTTVDNCWAISHAGNARPTTASTGSTLRNTTEFWGISHCDSNGAYSPAGAYTQTQTYASVATQGGVIVSFAPSAGGAAFTKPNFKGFSRL